MNKVLKGLVAVAATAAMAVAGFAGASTATAVEGETATAVKTSYTISFPTDTKYQGHTYEVYQIFTGDFDGKVLSNVKYGVNGTETAGTEGDRRRAEAAHRRERRRQDRPGEA